MSFTRLIIQKSNSREEETIRSIAKADGLEIVEITEKQISRNHVELRRTDFVAGSVPFIKHALRLLKIDLGLDEPYPEPIRRFLRREVTYLSNLRDAKQIIDKSGEFFIKPRIAKKFTGFVTADPHDYRFNGCGANTPVILSEVVEFVSEWRLYIHDERIALMERTPHSGTVDWRPSAMHVRDMIVNLRESGYQKNYVLDVGVLKDCRTALVEVNDAFAVGLYGRKDPTKDRLYYNLLTARWKEIVEGRNYTPGCII